MAEQTVYEVVINGIPKGVKNLGELGKAVKTAQKEFLDADFGDENFKQLQKNYNQLKGVQSQVTAAEKEYRQSRERTNKAIAVAASETTTLAQKSRALKTLLEVLDPNTEQFEKYEKQLASVGLEQERLRKRARSVKKALELSQIDPTSTRGLELTYGKLRGEIDLLSKEARKLPENIKKIGEAAKIQNEIKDLKGELNDFRDNIGNYPKPIRNLVSSFGELGFSIPDISKGALLASGAIAGIALAGEGLKQVGQYVRDIVLEFSNLRKEASLSTGVTGDELDKLTSRTDAIAKTFGKDFDEIIDVR